MARKTKEKAQPLEIQRFSRALNKTRLAAMMGVLGLLCLVVARFFLSPEWIQPALMVFVVGVVSSLLSVGGTYVGNCPYCGAKTAYANAFGVRRAKCSRCAKPIAVHKTKEGFFFRRA